MAWTKSVTRSTGDLISAAIWNADLGVGGNIDHIHSGLHWLFNTATYQSGNNWQTHTAFLTGKLLPIWNHLPVKGDWFTGILSNQFRFGTAMTSALNDSTATSAGDSVIVLFIKDEA